jgi:hypothetical protein
MQWPCLFLSKNLSKEQLRKNLGHIAEVFSFKYMLPLNKQLNTKWNLYTHLKLAYIELVLGIDDMM